MAGEIARATDVAPRKVYQLLAKLEELGAPITRELRDIDDRARGPSGLRITVDGLRQWLG